MADRDSVLYAGLYSGGDVLRWDLLDSSLYPDPDSSANAAPTCAIAAPAAGFGAAIGATTTVSGTWSDPEKQECTVEIYLGATKLGDATVGAGTWTYAWTPTAEQVGVVSLTAVVTDPSEATRTSAAVIGSVLPLPTVDTLVLPALSDEHVQLTTLICSAGTDYVALVEGTGAAPEYPGAGWVAYDPDAPPSIDVTGSGSVVIKVYPHSPGGVGAGVSGTVGCVVPGLVTWIEPAKDMTVVTGTNPYPTTFSSWSLVTNLTPYQDEPDHLGGTAAWRFEEAQTNIQHRVYSAQPGSAVEGPVLADIIIKNYDRYVELYGSIGYEGIWTLSNPPTVATVRSGVTWSSPEALSDGWWLLHADMQNMSLNNYQFGQYAAYTGEAGKGYKLYQYLLTQHRCNTMADQFGWHDFARSSAGSQPFARKADGTSPGGVGIDSGADLWQPNGVAKGLSNADADLLTLLEGGTFTIISRQCWMAQYGAYFGFVEGNGAANLRFGFGSGGAFVFGSGGDYNYANKTCSTNVPATLAVSCDNWTSHLYKDAESAGSPFGHTQHASGLTSVDLVVIYSAMSATIVSSRALTQAQIQAIGATL